MKSIIYSILFISTFSLLFSCRDQIPAPVPLADTIIVKDTVFVPQTVASGNLSFEFTNVDLNENEIIMNTQKYLNANGDTFKVSMFKYYISNIKIKKADGSFWFPKESYYLINQDEVASRKFTISNVPLGDYTGIEFSVGVDNVRNHTGAQTGALDAANGMFWTWNTGYIFLKLEGDYSTSGGSTGALVFHIGNDSNFKNLEFNSLPTTISIRDGKNTDVKILTKFQEMFGTPTTIDFSTINNVQGGANTSVIANNYTDMFKVNSITNQP